MAACPHHGDEFYVEKVSVLTAPGRDYMTMSPRAAQAVWLLSPYPQKSRERNYVIALALGGAGLLYGLIAAAEIALGGRRFVVSVVETVLIDLAAVVAVSIFVVRGRRERRTQDRIASGAATARAAQDVGYYCERCDGAFFAEPIPGAELPVGMLLRVRDFRYYMWEAGGYGDLAGGPPLFGTPRPPQQHTAF